MGILRFLFALSVLLVHSSQYNFLVGGKLAVQCFYMFSGFLISFILIDSRSYTNLKFFYINRILRIYPLYLIVLSITFFSYLISFFIFENDMNYLLEFYINNNFKINFILIISNIFIFFQDWFFFLGTDNNSLYLVEHFSDSEIVLSKGLVLPQSWTLSLELFFYLLAPFVLKDKKVIFFIIFLSVFLRVYLAELGLFYDPWSYRFFPNEISLFLFGSLSHQLLYPKISQFISKFKNLCASVTVFMILLIIVYPLINVNIFIKDYFILILFFFLMPFTFVFQNQNKFDRFIGELSYPVYILHISIIIFSQHIVEYFSLSTPITVITLFLTILFSIIVNLLINNPINKIRNKFKKLHSE